MRATSSSGAKTPKTPHFSRQVSGDIPLLCTRGQRLLKRQMHGHPLAAIRKDQQPERDFTTSSAEGGRRNLTFPLTVLDHMAEVRFHAAVHHHVQTGVAGAFRRLPVR